MLNAVTYHDDWGTERDTFFSEKMMEAMVLEPTRKIISHIKGSGVYFELHSCGRVERFYKYMAECKVDQLQIQERTNNFKKLKCDWGTKLGFGIFMKTPLRGTPKDAITASIRDLVDSYGANGGMYANAGGFDAESDWDAIWELYCFSREFYDKEAGR